MQPLLDRAAGKLKGWKGRFLSRKGRLALINSVLTSTATYFLTVFPGDKWLIKRLDKLRRNFLWAPDEEANGGKCLVGWKKICAPTDFGGLGIKDLTAYSRALRLRWEWFRWTDPARPWHGTETPCDQTDKDLFSACTKITLGDGETAKFWSDKWLDGFSPSFLAPLCFPLASRKNLTVKEALTDGRWMRGLLKISSEAQLDQFVRLWDMLQEVTLSESKDGISWCSTADGKYSAVSAYSAQFHGRIKQPGLHFSWSVRAEGKVQFFIWLLLQNRNWTAERLRARGLPHDASCCLCDQEFETSAHLALRCPFAKEVWANFQGSNPAAVRMAMTSTTVAGWWEKVRRGRMDENRKQDVSVSAYIVWHVWKERGRRIFQNLVMTASSVSVLVKNDIQLVAQAKSRVD